MTSASELADRLGRLAGRRGTAGARSARGRDRLLRLADLALAPTPEEATRILHAVLSGVKRKAISERFAAKLLDKMLPNAKPARSRPTVALDLPKVTDAVSFATAQAEILRAVAGGEMSPAEGKAMGDVLTRTWEARCVVIRSAFIQNIRI